MTIEEIKKAKNDAAFQITEIIKALEKETGCYVKDIKHSIYEDDIMRSINIYIQMEI
jgi:hypothetical protein